MNAAILLLSLSAGGDPAGPGCHGPGCGAAPAPACDGCGDAKKANLLDRLKAKHAPKPKASDCGGCDPCGGAPAVPNLLDALKSRRGKHHKAADCGGCDPCGGAAAAAGCAGQPAATPPPTDAPKEMPKPKDTAPPKVDVPKTEGPKGGNAGAVVVPPLPVTPVSGPKLNGANSPY